MPFRSPRVLVVEDDAGIRDLLRTQLVGAGYDVHTATTGVEALGRAGELTPDAMVLDLNLPGLDGFGVLRTLSRHPGRPLTPTLILSARQSPDDVRQAILLGARDYLTKPFQKGQLLRRVARLLQRRETPVDDAVHLI